jgi:ParB/RepB/Spo0J family partition protein
MEGMEKLKNTGLEQAIGPVAIKELENWGIVNVNLAWLRESKTNPRSGFDAAGLKELAESMRAHGVLEPLMVRPVNGQPAKGEGETPPPQFEIVLGARRFRAAKLAKLESVPAIVRELTDTEALEMQIIENLQREGMQPLDEGLGYRALIDQAGYDVAKIAEKIGKSASYVYQRLKLADLTKPAQKALAGGDFKRRTAEAVPKAPTNGAGKTVQVRVEVLDAMWAGLEPEDKARLVNHLIEARGR